MQNKGCLIAAIIAGSFLLLSFLGCIGLATLGAYQQAQEEEARRQEIEREEEVRRQEIEREEAAQRQEIEREQNRIKQLATGRSFKDIQVKPLGNLKFSLRTSWREGVMNYHFSVSPYKHDFLSNYATNPIQNWTIYLEDDQGFNVHEFILYRSSLLRNTADDGSSTGMEYKGSITMDRKEYESISNWNVSWMRVY